MNEKVKMIRHDHETKQQKRMKFSKTIETVDGFSGMCGISKDRTLIECVRRHEHGDIVLYRMPLTHTCMVLLRHRGPEGRCCFVVMLESGMFLLFLQQRIR